MRKQPITWMQGDRHYTLHRPELPDMRWEITYRGGKKRETFLAHCPARNSDWILRVARGKGYMGDLSASDDATTAQEDDHA